LLFDEVPSFEDLKYALKKEDFKDPVKTPQLDWCIELINSLNTSQELLTTLKGIEPN
jgi:hypothetical protein